VLAPSKDRRLIDGRNRRDGRTVSELVIDSPEARVIDLGVEGWGVEVFGDEEHLSSSKFGLTVNSWPSLATWLRTVSTAHVIGLAGDRSGDLGAWLTDQGFMVVCEPYERTEVSVVAMRQRVHGDVWTGRFNSEFRAEADAAGYEEVDRWLRALPPIHQFDLADPFDTGQDLIEFLNMHGWDPEITRPRAPWSVSVEVVGDCLDLYATSGRAGVSINFPYATDGMAEVAAWILDLGAIRDLTIHPRNGENTRPLTDCLADNRIHLEATDEG
jgi:hypothetical protein